MTAHPLKAAVIGVGKAGGGGPKGGGHAIGYTHAEMFKSSPGVSLLAGCDINPDNLAAFQHKFDVPHGYASLDAMLKELRPDVVSIATYVGLHSTMIEACARAGVRGILCEKPFLASVPQCRRVEQVARETGVKIIVAHVRRYRPAFIRARHLINDGAIGTPLLFFAGIDDWDLSEWGSHWLDMFRFLNNDRAIRTVFGQARVRGLRGYGHAMEDHAVACFDFDNNVRGLLDGGRAMANGGEITLVGADGVLRVIEESKLVLTNRDGQSDEDFTTAPGNAWPDLWSAALVGLIAWIEGGPEPTVALPSMLKTAELNLAAYLSAVRGDRIDLPLDDDTDEWPVEALARRAAQR